MTIFEHWQQQKDGLYLRLGTTASMADAVYQVRHAILQTEQNALAEMSDDILRQQAGILFGTVKNAVGFLEASKACAPVLSTKSARPKPERGQVILSLIACALWLILTVCCYFKGWLLATVLSLCALLIGAAALFWKGAPAPAEEKACRSVPDLDRLFVLLDGQMRSIDRSLNDFAYLNEQLSCGADPADEAALSRAADLMEALLECDEADRADAEEAAHRLLRALGFCAVMYSEESSRLFNVLPSKTITRTLSPAIISAQDQRLLRRGTAAVCTNAA